MKTSKTPNDGLAGLKENWRSDAISGFLIFLIAMPLCLAISKASGFPPIAGIYTAIIGGILVSFFMGARITIKGPAAGLIAIAVGAVEELGRGDNTRGYQLTLAVIIMASVIQILFGLLKAGKLGDFFPASAVHGMLAAIGIIIISKQIPVLLGAKPASKEPLELLAEVPNLLVNMNPEVAFIGLLCLVILFVMPQIKRKALKHLPPSMIALLVAIPLAIYYDFAHEHDYSLAHINYHIIPGNLLVQLPDSFLGGITFPDFSEIGSLTSLKYIVMFSLVGSLESILSSKAIDVLDPYKRKSNLNADILSVGIGNLAAGSIGGLPMISEIVRSSANINNGAKTRWANFFHGVFLLVFVTLAADLIEMIPNAALAAMLIYTGYRLASPKEFQRTWAIGWDQLIIFISTIVVTLLTDLLLGISAGVAVQFVLHFFHGVSIKALFISNVEVTDINNEYVVRIKDAAVFSNYLSFKKCLDKLQPGRKVIFNFADAMIVDHTLLEHLHHFEEDYHSGHGHVVIQGLGKHSAHSQHPLATRKFSRSRHNRMEFRLNERQSQLRDFAEHHAFAFYPMTIRNMIKFKDFPIEKGTRILYEENILSAYTEQGKIEISDITLTEGARMAQEDTKITVVYLSDLRFTVPDFALEPEHLCTALSQLSFGKDIDFPSYPTFSKKYYLRSEDEAAIRVFFTPYLIKFLEESENIHIESHRNKLLIYKRRDELENAEIEDVLKFIKRFVQMYENNEIYPLINTKV
jgi:MFS superfamily sulfate permease-like transporter